MSSNTIDFDASAQASVLCLSGHDPSGGAGLQADIETLAAHGVHAFGVITALTVQDSSNVARVIPVDPSLLREQLDCLLSDCRPAVIKLGLIGNADQLPMILDAIRLCGVPVVCDPVLRAGGGRELVADDFAARLVGDLFPQVAVLTPNAAEARRLTPDALDLDACGYALLAAGCEHVLITGGDEASPGVINTHYHGTSSPTRYDWPRLPETFHGAGCTLASAIAARLARGETPDTAILDAQRWTQESLHRAIAVGHGRRIPGRFGR